jgi:hypothetical protein
LRFSQQWRFKLRSSGSADDFVLLATSEDDLQQSVYNLNTITTKYGMVIPTERTKILFFQGKEPIPSKIYIDTRILERVNKFIYLGYT